MPTQRIGVVVLLALVLLMPVASTVTAGPNEILILEPTVNPPANTSREYYWVQQLGFTPVVVNNATWSSMSTAQFSDYEAIVLGDPNCAGDTTPVLAAIQNQAVWNAAVDGNVILIGTDAALHAPQGGDSLIKYGIAYATNDAGSGKTGAFIELSCYYNNSTPVQVTMLDSLSSQGTFSVFSSQCHNQVHMVVSHPALTNLTDSILSNWYCSTHEVFDSWPSDFVVLAIGRNLGSYLAIDGSIGQPYILVRGEDLTSTNCVNPPTGMMNWWPLDELSGPTSVDIRGTPNNGLHVGSPTPVAGKVQGALQFDGVNDQVDIVDAAEVNFGTGDFSIDAWIRTSIAGGTAALVDKIDAATSTGYSLLLQSGILSLQLADGSSTTYSSGYFVADGDWHLVAVTVDRDAALGITFYVDGLPVSNANPTLHPGSLTNTDDLVLGARTSTGSDRFSGEMDEVEMYDRVLSDFDIFTLRLADSLGKCSLEVVAGACCIPQSGCFLTINEEECDSLGGFYLGDSTSCDSNTCEVYALGVCCLPDGTCVDSVGHDSCAYGLGGLFQGYGTTCATTECLLQGACCIPGGPAGGGPGAERDTCIMTMGPDACLALGGTYFGDGTFCDSILCDTCLCLATGDIDNDGTALGEIDLEILIGIVYGWIPPIDSMCHADLNGDCVIDQADIDLLQCYLTYGYSCFSSLGGYPVATCCDPSTVTGACCVIDTCYQYAQQNCLEGSYQGDSTWCASDTCNQDTTVIIDTVIIIIISWPPIDIDPVGPVVVGPFDPGPSGVVVGVLDTNIIVWNAAWEELEPAGTVLPTGAFLRFKAYQRMPGAVDQPIGTARATKTLGGQWMLEADFNGIGATTHSVQVFHNDLVVATLQQHSGMAGLASKPPDDWHWKTHAPGARIQHGCTGTWGSPVEIELLHPTREGVHHTMADSVKFIPENQTIPTDFLSGVVVTAAGIPFLSFTKLSAEAEPCCENRGNVDGQVGVAGPIDVADLSYLVDYLFRGGTVPPCAEEANIDGIVGVAGPIDVADLSYLVNYLFRGGPIPSPCI